MNWMQSTKAKGIELPVMSMVNNYDGKDWKVDEMAEMLARPASREKLAKALEAFANSEHEPGIVVDFEEVPQESQENFQHFIHDLAVALHSANLKLMVALPAADWSYDYKYFASQADVIILMNYDFHWPASAPGPVVSQDWFVRNINNILKLVPPQKIVMGISAAEIGRIIGRGAGNRNILLGVLFEAMFFGALLYLLSQKDVSLSGR